MAYSLYLGIVVNSHCHFLDIHNYLKYMIFTMHLMYCKEVRNCTQQTKEYSLVYYLNFGLSVGQMSNLMKYGSMLSTNYLLRNYYLVGGLQGILSIQGRRSLFFLYYLKLLLRNGVQPKICNRQKVQLEHLDGRTDSGYQMGSSLDIKGGREMILIKLHQFL